MKFEKFVRQVEFDKTNKSFINFSVGDTISVSIKVEDLNRSKIQNFDGIVIAKRNKGFYSSFILRKISYGISVERVFHYNNPNLINIKIKKYGKVRQAKLYYLRNLSGKSFRVKVKYKNN